MLNLLDSIRAQCPEVGADLIFRHFNCLSPSYFERHSAAEIARHLRLLAGLNATKFVDVEVRPLATQAFEVIVVGSDQPGSLACITVALAAQGFDCEDVQVASYLDADTKRDGDAKPRFFVNVLRVSGSLAGQEPTTLAEGLRERLQGAFSYLVQGDLLKAQAVAADPFPSSSQESLPTPRRGISAAITGRFRGYTGLVLGGDFRLERKLAAGGMGEIYLATQLSLNRTVAVKLFPHKGSADDELLARFNQEALVLAQFTCAHVVPVYAAGSGEDYEMGKLSWMAMEYMAGGDLGRRLQEEGSISIDLATRWLRHALEGLHHAHQRSILHRDLKPHNLLLSADGNLKVSDFGLLKQVEQEAADLTPQAVILGTPHYMSPEQALGEALDERSDIFSLGSTFFHLLSGRLPFDKGNPTAILVQIAQQDGPSLMEVAPQVPRPLAVLIGRMMARHREDRYQGVGVILEDLASYERRGLLKSSENGGLIPGQGMGILSAPVQAETGVFLPSLERPEDKG